MYDFREAVDDELARVARQGVDFTCNLESFVHTLRRHAAEHDKRCKVEIEYRNHTVKYRFHNDPPEHKIETSTVSPLCQLVAVDGAGHKNSYNVLMASTGEYIESETGLETLECLEFLTNLRAKYPSGKFIGYGLRYDSEMILEVFPDSTLEWLNKRQSKIPTRIAYKNYTVGYQRKRELSVRRNDVDPKHSIIIDDVASWFGETSDAAVYNLLGYEIPAKYCYATPDLEQMKSDLRIRLPAICELVQKLWDRAETLGGLRGRLNGPGVLAGSVLGRHGAKSFMFPLEPFSFEVREAIAAAFYAPRTESYYVGHSKQTNYDGDINSAHASGMLELPNLATGTWKHIAGKPDELTMYGLYYVEDYDWPIDKPGPLPKYVNGKLIWTHVGKGWHWGPRLKAIWDTVKVSEAYIFIDDGTRPFAEYVTELFERRKEDKLTDFILKKTLASTWGKFIQQRGYSRQDDGTIILPPYHCLEHAGFLTAYTDMLLLQFMLDVKGTIIGTATDGLQWAGEPLDEVPGIGGRKIKAYDGGVYLASHKYWLYKDGEVQTFKHGGVTADTLDINEVLDLLRTLEYADWGYMHSYRTEDGWSSRACIPMKSVQFRNRRWEESDATIQFGFWHDETCGCKDSYASPGEALHLVWSPDEWEVECHSYQLAWDRDKPYMEEDEGEELY